MAIERLGQKPDGIPGALEMAISKFIISYTSITAELRTGAKFSTDRHPEFAQRLDKAATRTASSTPHGAVPATYSLISATGRGASA